MELNKQHREALLSELQKAKEDLELQHLTLNKSELEEDKEHLLNWFEIGMFLAQERVKLIEKSLIDNEIDF